MSGRRPALLLLALALAAAPAAARQAAVITGVPGALDYAALRAERLGPAVARPSLEPLGAEDAVVRFCAGLGAQAPDALAMLRRLRFDERERCAANGVGDLAEVDLGWVGFIVLGAPADGLSRRQLWRALAASLIEAGRIEANPFHSWRAVDPGLPATPLRLAGPDPASPMGALLASLVLEEACESVPDLARRLAREPGLGLLLCGSLRRDEVYRAGAGGEPGTTLFLPITELDRLGVGAAAIEGVWPDRQTVESGNTRSRAGSGSP